MGSNRLVRFDLKVDRSRVDKLYYWSKWEKPQDCKLSIRGVSPAGTDIYVIADVEISPKYKAEFEKFMAT